MSTRRELPKIAPTDPAVFFGRRRFVADLARNVAGLSLAPTLLASCSRAPTTSDPPPSASGAGGAADADHSALNVPFDRPEVFPAARNQDFQLSRPLTPRAVAAVHNNFYEFLPGRGGPVHQFVDSFQVTPWKLEVIGLCRKPRTFDLDDLFRFAHEERVYHFRCVERWAMNVPWTGFPLAELLKRVEPQTEAKYIRFISANRPEQMPGIRQAAHYPWPYYEALRMDEGLNDLTMIVTGVYGQPLLKQHGAPVRIICPWKYGYKSPKSIVRIELTDAQPGTFWSDVTSSEYGFLSNVNPNIPHPRWSQAFEYRLEDPDEREPTEIFNGYGDFVAHLYPDEPRAPLAAAPRQPR